jgi:hypothetical protein
VFISVELKMIENQSICQVLSETLGDIIDIPSTIWQRLHQRSALGSSGVPRQGVLYQIESIGFEVMSQIG